MGEFIQQYVEQIKRNNDRQGKNGTYYGYASRNAAIIRSIFVYRKNRWDPDLIDAVVDAASETLLYSKENVRTKLDTISLLICIIMKYPEDYKRNIEVYTKLYEQNESISASGNSFFEANIDSISLQICLNLLFTAMDVDTYTKILELFPLIQNDTATSISVARIVDEYFEVSDAATLPTGVEAVVLQNVLAWLRSDCLDLRCIASRICLALARNPNNGNIVEHQLINLIDSDCAYIKNSILRRLSHAQGVSASTKSYIMGKCESDPNYVVRMVCSEEMRTKSKR